MVSGMFGASATSPPAYTWWIVTATRSVSDSMIKFDDGGEFRSRQLIRPNELIKDPVLDAQFAAADISQLDLTRTTALPRKSSLSKAN